MINYILVLPTLASFFITLFLMPFWIKKAKQLGLLWDDMNKIKSQKVAGSGGLMVILGFIIGAFLYVAYRIFYFNSTEYILEIFAMLSVILLLAGIGLIDDLFGWQHGGLSRRSRIILVLLASIQLIAINAGKSSISLPFIGQINLGLIYPLIIIPLGIVGATTTFNFLAGFNGLEAGQGIILLSAISIVSYFTGSPWLALISLCMVSALFAFLLFNFTPANVFPGDVLTYPIGGLIAISAILGNFEKIAIFFFIPYILEVILKTKGKLIKQSFGHPNPDGSLSLKYEKVYGLTHLSILILNGLGIKATEKRVVYLIWSFQILVVLIGLIIFRNGIFQ